MPVMPTAHHPQPAPNSPCGQTRGLMGGWRLEVGRWPFSALLLFACLGGGFAPCLLGGNTSDQGDEPSTLQLNATASVDSDGIFLRQLVAADAALPELRLGNAPAVGQAVVFRRAQLSELLRTASGDAVDHPALVCTNWTGAEAIRVTRRERALGEADLLTMLTAVLQQEYVKDKGELELRLTRPWTERKVPDEPLTLKVLELPNTGVTPSCIVRFELRTAHETVGNWQACVQAKVWREAWVARSALKRGDLIADADLARERRDVLMIRDSLADFAAGDPTLEMAEPLQVGTPLLTRSVRVRPVIHRGQLAEARVQDGALQVTLKVEALEDGAPGQTIRARNLLSRRNLTGKVLDEQTILVSL